MCLHRYSAMLPSSWQGCPPGSIPQVLHPKKQNRKDESGSYRRSRNNGKSMIKPWDLQQCCTVLFKAPLTLLQRVTCSEGFSCTSITKHTSRDKALNGLQFHRSVQCTWCSNLSSSPPHFMEKVLQKHKVSTYQLGKFMVLTPLLGTLTPTIYFVCNKKFWCFLINTAL